MSELFERFRAALKESYDLQEEVGRGAAAIVYRARDVKHDRDVAVKVLRPELSATLAVERFLREIKITARLEHPHILTLLDSGESEGYLYYVMPFVEGETLEDRLNAEGALPVDDALRIAGQVASALSYAHEHGVVHRDIKPHNILLSSGQAVVSDFGVASALSKAGGEDITSTGVSLGTPQYMSPEQADPGLENDARGDIYSLGCVLFEMLAGDPPFRGASWESIVYQHLSQPPPDITGLREDVSPALAVCLDHALAKNPTDRWPTAGEFQDRLEAVRRGEGAQVRHSGAGARWGGKRILLAAAGAGTTALVAWWGFSALTTAPAAASPSGPPSVAVLPLRDISPGGGDEYFADGMAEAVLDALAGVEGVRVAARTSSFAFRDRNEDVRTIGRELSVSTVLEGSVARDGDRVRVRARLLNTSDGFEIWGDTYDRDVQDVFLVQDEIARAIVDALEVTLVGRADGPLVVASTHDLEAYNDYLRGVFFWNKRTPADIRQAIDWFGRAIDLDPEYALAHVGLASAYAVLPFYGPDLPLDVYPEAKAAVERALALDSTLAEAHAALAVIRWWYEWDWASAGEEFRVALAGRPEDVTARHWHAAYLVAVGRTEEGVAEARRALETDPLSLIVNRNLADFLSIARRFDEAVDQYRTTLRMDPSYSSTRSWLADTYLAMGRIDDARREAGLGADSARLAEVLAVSGEREEARRMLDRILTRPVETREVPRKIARVYLALGDLDAAFAALERAFDEHSQDLAWPYLQRAVWDPVRDDPRFRSLVDRIGFAGADDGGGTGG